MRGQTAQAESEVIKSLKALLTTKQKEKRMVDAEINGKIRQLRNGGATFEDIVQSLRMSNVERLPNGWKVGKNNVH